MNSLFVLNINILNSNCLRMTNEDEKEKIRRKCFIFVVNFLSIFHLCDFFNTNVFESKALWILLEPPLLFIWSNEKKRISSFIQFDLKTSKNAHQHPKSNNSQQFSTKLTKSSSYFLPIVSVRCIIISFHFSSSSSSSCYSYTFPFYLFEKKKW